MELFGSSQVSGDLIQLKATNARHFGVMESTSERQNEDGIQAFSDVLVDAFKGANDMEQQSVQLARDMVTDPDSVDAHDVTIAMAKANLAVNITKQVVERAVKAYREIISIR